MHAPPRNAAERRRDALHRLEYDVDAWVATADTDSGTPHLVPLSFLWDGESLLLSTPAASTTGRNLAVSGRVRVGIGATRDVVLVEGTARQLPPAEITRPLGDAFAVKTGFDPRTLDPPYPYFRVRPVRIQAWREADELAGRDLMRDGAWLVCL